MHDLISQLRERKREVEFGTTLCSMGMIMNGLMLHLVQKVVVGMANKYNTKCNDVRYHICNIKQHNSARTTRKATIVARYKQYAYTTNKLQVEGTFLSTE